MAITTIAFDLDDTLLDTSGLLVPEASKQAFNILIENGLKLSLAECETQRLHLIKTISHKDLFWHLAKNHGNEKTLLAVPLATRAFYEPVIPAQLPLLPGAREILENLSKKYSLYVVTAGYESGQHKKISSLNVAHFFKKIFVVNSLNGDRKIQAFREILKLENIQQSQLLCIGNSLSSEMKDAKELGAVSCYFEFGEDRGQVPQNPAQKPDYHIKKLEDFINTCKI